jgi:hypothetical protein
MRRSTSNRLPVVSVLWGWGEMRAAYRLLDYPEAPALEVAKCATEFQLARTSSLA